MLTNGIHCDIILKDNKELVDKGDWGALVGVLEKGVAKKD